MRSSAALALGFAALASLLLLYSNSTSISQYRSQHPHADSASSAPSQVDELKRLIAVQQKQLDSLAPLVHVQTQAVTSAAGRRPDDAAAPKVEPATKTLRHGPSPPIVDAPRRGRAAKPAPPAVPGTAAANEPPPAEASSPTLAPVTSPTMPPVTSPTMPPVARPTAAVASKMVAAATTAAALTTTTAAAVTTTSEQVAPALTTTTAATKGWLGRWKPRFTATSSNVK